MTALSQHLQSSRFGAYVELFCLDARAVGGPLMYFTQGADPNAQPIRFGGVVYQPVDCEFEGFEVNGNGALPTPKFRIANTDGIVQDIINTHGDLLSCNVSRVRTYGRYLDGAPDADPEKYVGPDIFRVEQKTAENEIYVEWELSASIDQEGKKLPGRLVINDVCQWRYRAFNPETGQLEPAPGTRACPYAGSAMFDALDRPVTDPAKDVCSLNYSGCRLRYGRGAALPFGGFLGVARVKV